MRNEIAGKMGKKRKKGIEDIELERSLYNSFCTAANSVSQLYTQAQHQQKRAFAAGARTSTERILQWLTKEYAGSPHLPVEAIAAFLMKEVDRLDSDDAALSEQYLSITQQQQQQQQQAAAATAAATAAARQPPAQAPAHPAGQAREAGHAAMQPCLVDAMGGAAGAAMPPPPPSPYGRRGSNSGSSQSPRRGASKHVPFGSAPSHPCNAVAGADPGGGAMGGYPAPWVGVGMVPQQQHPGQAQAQEYHHHAAEGGLGYSTGGGGAGYPCGFHDRISREDPGGDEQDGPEDIAMS
eukprot:jgi/Mesvir1/13083/Mv06067-RA.1